MIYCPAPRKVDSSYLTNEYELVNIGCSSSPPPPSDAQAIRRERMKSEGEIIRGNANEQAAQREGPNEDGIGEEVNFTGSTENQQLGLEIGLEESRIQAEDELETRSAPLASMPER